MVKVHKSDESAELALRFWLREVTNSLDLLRERGSTVGVNVMTEEVKLTDTKQTLVGVDDNPMREESLKDSSQILQVLFWGGTSNENVINVGIYIYILRICHEVLDRLTVGKFVLRCEDRRVSSQIRTVQTVW